LFERIRERRRDDIVRIDVALIEAADLMRRRWLRRQLAEPDIRLVAGVERLVSGIERVKYRELRRRTAET